MHFLELNVQIWIKISLKFVSKGSINNIPASLCTNAGILLIGRLGTNFSEILIEIYKLSLKKMLLKMLSGKWEPSCLGLDVLTHWGWDKMTTF